MCHTRASNPKYNFGFGVKKYFGKLEGSTTSLEPSVSCKVYGESKNVSPYDGDLVQRELPKPPFEDLDFILVGLGERG